MFKLTEDLGRMARFATQLRPEVTAFQASYEVSRWVRKTFSARSERVVPTALYLETSSACRGRCRGCYVPVQDRKAAIRLEDKTLRQVIAAAQRLKPNYVCIVGGEPLDPTILQTNVEMITNAPDLRFLVCTGGHGHCDAQLMRALGELPNLTLFFSMDGLASTHDAVRGRGNHARSIEAIRNYSRAGSMICGASVTLRPENSEEVSSNEFIASLESAGVNFIGFDPWFSDDPSAILSPEVLSSVIQRLKAIARESSSVFFVNPFGRLHHDGFDPDDGWVAVSVDYHGNVYGSRRGQILGNVTETDLQEIIEGDLFQSSCRDLGVGGCTTDDPRRSLFETTLRLVSAQ